MSATVRTCLSFPGNGLEAAEYYVSLVPNSRIEASYSRVGSEAPMMIDLLSGGAPYQILNDGNGAEHSLAASIVGLTDDQSGTDALWDALADNGGEGMACGWLKDRFGVAWQIVPKLLPQLMASGDSAKVARVMDALLSMKKIESARLQSAFDGR